MSWLINIISVIVEPIVSNKSRSQNQTGHANITASHLHGLQHRPFVQSKN